MNESVTERPFQQKPHASTVEPNLLAKYLGGIGIM